MKAYRQHVSPFSTHWQAIMVFINVRDRISSTSVLCNVRKKEVSLLQCFGALKHIFSSQNVNSISLQLMRYCRWRPPAGKPVHSLWKVPANPWPLSLNSRNEVIYQTSIVHETDCERGGAKYGGRWNISTKPLMGETLDSFPKVSVTVDNHRCPNFYFGQL